MKFQHLIAINLVLAAGFTQAAIASGPVRIAIDKAYAVRLFAGALTSNDLSCSSAPAATANYPCLAGKICLQADPQVTCGLPDAPVIVSVAENDYLAAVIPAEIGGNAPIEAQKAQAVAARSYVRAKQKERQALAWDVKATILDQVFNPALVTMQSITAASETSGLVLKFAGKILPAFFHSSCGGQTTTPLEVWGSAVAGYEAAICPLSGEQHRHWEASVATSIDTTENNRDSSGRLKLVNGRPAAEFRKNSGYSVVKSTLVDSVFQDGRRTIIAGRGFGHGIGMCQEGAIAMAKNGADFRQILAVYFPLATVASED